MVIFLVYSTGTYTACADCILHCVVVVVVVGVVDILPMVCATGGPKFPNIILYYIISLMQYPCILQLALYIYIAEAQIDSDQWAHFTRLHSLLSSQGLNPIMIALDSCLYVDVHIMFCLFWALQGRIHMPIKMLNVYI